MCRQWKISPGSDEEKQVIQEYTDGWTLDSIATKRNVTPNLIRRLLIRTNTPIRRRGYAKYRLDGLTYDKRSYRKMRADPKRRKKYNDQRYFNRIKKKYGMSKEEHDVLLSLHKDRCAVCKGPPNKDRFRVDHDHKTGSVRGLLCDRCNRVLGFVDDSVEILESAIHYLETRLV